MSIAVINPGGRKKVYQSLGQNLTAIEPPLWSRLITGYLIDRDIDTTIIDTEALEIDNQECAEQILNISPTLVVIVVYGHQPSASTQSMIAARDLGQSISNSNYQGKVLIVGGHVAALAEQTIKEEPVDFSCSGEGPETVFQLYNALKNNTSLHDVAGLVWKDEFGVIKTNPSAPLITDLDKQLHGNVWHLLPMDKYRAHNWHCFGELEERQPYASIYTTLGCPYKCIFCCINAPFNETKYRCRSPEAVVNEIDMLVSVYGVTTFKIIDEMFVLKKNHYLKICQLLAEKSYADKLNIWAYARVDTIKKDTLALMRKAGIKWLALGIESADDKVRDGANKSLKENDIINIVRDIQDADISVIGNYIFGLPHDSVETMTKTLVLAKELNCEFANFYSAMAYPGSQLYANAIKDEKQLPDDWSGYSQHSTDCLPLATEYETSATVLKFRDDAFHNYFSDPKYLEMVANKFGQETAEHIIEMSETRLKRNIVL